MNLRIVSKPTATNAPHDDVVTSLDTCIYVVEDDGTERPLWNVTKVSWGVDQQGAYTWATLEFEGVQLDVTTDASTALRCVGLVGPDQS